MKLNIVTILLFTLLLSAGLSTKSAAQDWRWRRHCGYGMDTAFERNFEHCGRWGYAPRRFYRRAMWCGDTAMCHGWCGRPYRWGRYNRWENWKDADANFEKYHKDMEDRWKSYNEDMKNEEKEFHEHWKDSKWDGDYGWRWHRRWRSDYYYRGAGY